MPRGAKKNAHQHNSKHENGIVAPGKRITKQKSNGHLSGSPDARSRANTPPLPASSAAQVGTTDDNDANADSFLSTESANGGTGYESRGKSLADVISEDLEVADNGKSQSHTGRFLDQNHRKIDASAAKPRSVLDNSAVHLALTVLKACPLRDTLAILLFLLSLPPTFLTLTNTVFAILTFIPPTGSFSGLPTLSDFFQAYSAPLSFSTMCIVDLIGIAFWLPMFKPMQSLVLDWAQAMVATTLGGGYSNRPGGSDSTLLCISLVSATHLSRYKRLILRIMHRTWLGRWAPIVRALSSTPPASPDPGSSGRPIFRNVKTLIALHIIIQGLARLIRKWALKFKDNQAIALASSLSDPEAIAGYQPNSDSTGLLDLGQNPPSSPTDLRSKGSLQSLRDAKDRVSAGKRKRKQGNYVRSKQPLWAAFAATKATIMREYEQSQATKDAMGSNATDTENLGSAPFIVDDGRIWVSTVHPNSFSFETGFFPINLDVAPNTGEDSDWIDENGIDRSKPFYVRINGADWTSAKIDPVAESEHEPGHGYRWAGEVYGLSPAYSYQCCFVRSEDDVVIHSDTVATPSSASTEQGMDLIFRTILNDTNEDPASSAIIAAQVQPIRPSSPASPVTTLKTSIAAYETTLDEASSQQRRIRKDGKANSINLKKDLDVLNDRMGRVGTNDRGLQNRQLQQIQHMRQADDAITLISDELENYVNLPEEQPHEWQEHKTSWDSRRDQQSTVQEDLSRFKDCNHRDSSSIQSEALTITQKRERLQHRTAKLSDQHTRMHHVTAHGTTEKERQLSEQTARFSGRHHHEANYQDQLNNLMRSFQDIQYHARISWQQVQALETSLEQQQQALNSHSRPITPEGDLPGTLPQSATSTGFRFPAFGTPDSFPSTTNGHSAARGRSTSMLSGNSVYTDFDEDPAPPPMPMMSRGLPKGKGPAGEDELAPPPMPTLNRGIAAVGVVASGRKGSGSGSSSGGGGQSPSLRKNGAGGSPLVE
ncbi:hypothetical protein MMC17_005637 [Xylographa soralifera]|nr:hypothetical protein [Xylographa soralifera]